MINDIVETQLINSLAQLTQNERLHWALCTTNSTTLDIKGKDLSEVNGFYEADLDGKTLVLYSSSDSRNNFYKSNFDTFNNTGGLSLIIINKISRKEELIINSRSLKSLFTIVKSKAGTRNSVILDVLDSAKKLLDK